MVTKYQNMILNRMMLYNKGQVFTRGDLARELGIDIQVVSRYLNRRKIKYQNVLKIVTNRRGDIVERVVFSHHFDLIELGNNILFRRK